MTARAEDIAARVESFVRKIIIPYERDPRIVVHGHGPPEDVVVEMLAKARAAGVMTRHILTDGDHLTQRKTAIVLTRSGLSPLGPVAVNKIAPDEGNMYLLGKVGSADLKARFLAPLVAGEARSAFLMTEPASEGGAGSDPSMMQTVCVPDGIHWVINGRKAFITGARSAKVGIVMAESEATDGTGGACLFLVDLPDPAIRIERVLDTIDSSMPAVMPSSRSTISAYPPTRCWGRVARGSNTRKSGCRPRACRTACAGSGLVSAPTRSRWPMPASAWRSASCWSIMRASDSCSRTI